MTLEQNDLIESTFKNNFRWTGSAYSARSNCTEAIDIIDAEILIGFDINRTDIKSRIFISSSREGFCSLFFARADETIDR